MIRCSMIWGCLLSGFLVATTGNAQQMAPPYGVYGNPSFIPEGGWNTPQHRPHRGWEEPGLPYDPELIPPLRERGFFYDFDSPIDLTIREELAGIGFRLEYLNWTVSKMDRTLLGAPLDGVPDPSEEFVVTLPNGTNSTAFVPTTDNLGAWTKQDGFKGTFVLPIWTGAVESSFWILEDDHRRFDATNLVQPDPNLIAFPGIPVDKPAFIATSLLSNGVPGNLVVLYDQFQAAYTNRIWSGDVNYYHELPMAADPWKVEPSIGFRYMNYNEYFDQYGYFDNRYNIDSLTGRLLNPIRSQINTTAVNNLYGLQLGMRLQLESKWVTLGVEPRAILGVNNYSTRVQTSNLRDSALNPLLDDGVTTSRYSKNSFWPAFDLGVNARIHVTDYATIRVGYNLLVMSNIARGPDAIYYNDNGILNPPAIVAKDSQNDVLIHGLSVGLEMQLR